MSASNRGTTRNAFDFYETPPWCSVALLPHLPRGGRLLDPCAGSGAILDAIGWAYSDMVGYEIQPELAEKYGFDCRDALGPEPWCRPAVIVTNPPYSQALQFAERAITECVAFGGTVAMLLRLNWLEGRKRAAFHKLHPCDVLVLSKRPSFTGNGTDATAYAWLVWGPGRGNRWQIMDLPHLNKNEENVLSITGSQDPPGPVLDVPIRPAALSPTGTISAHSVQVVPSMPTATTRFGVSK